MTTEEKAAMLARLVRQAFDRNDKLAMRLFGSNTAQMLAADVERALPAQPQESPRE